MAAFGLSLAAGILVGGVAAEGHFGRLGPGLVRFLDLRQGHLVRAYVSAAAFLAGQLAFLIWWLRSQSMQDFKGRYRGWACCGLLAFAAAFAIQTGAVAAWSQTVDWLWRADFRNKPALSWLVPAALCGIVVWRFLHREMRDCRASLPLLWVAALCAAAWAGLRLWSPAHSSAPAWRLVPSALVMLAAQFLFLSVLLQARHAIYVTVEPPAERPWRLAALWRRLRRSSAAGKGAGGGGGGEVVSLSRDRSRAELRDEKRTQPRAVRRSA